MNYYWPSKSALVILAVLTFVTPFWDLAVVKRLKADPHSSLRVRLYCMTLLSLWTMAIVSWFWRGGVVFPAWHGMIGPSWLFSSPWRTWTLHVVLVGFFVLALAPGMHCLIQPKRIVAYTRAYEKFAFFLPHTQRERLLFALLSVSAGVCEEWLFRGFVLQTLHGTTRLPWIAALLLSSMLFGWNHLYLGSRELVMTTVIGLALGLVTISNGGLVLPMILHTFLDLQLLIVFHPDISADVILSLAAQENSSLGS
ncbi:MAG: CPBP family intramembrane glutamic endopeptidase [Acidobacteriaceae bacterium]